MQEDQMIVSANPLSSTIDSKDLSHQTAKNYTHLSNFTAEKQKKFERYWNIIRQKLADKKQTEQNINKYKQLLLESQTNLQLDRALGSVYGAMIGDALGAYCQFCYSLSEQVVDEAMEMQGGGTFNLQSGQFTDDSQMATHLLKGLSQLDTKQILQKQEHRLTSNIALQYIAWYITDPFDIGNTCRGGIEFLCDYQDQLEESAKNFVQKPAFFEKMFNNIYARNKNSLANGSLMRISPFALFFSMINQNPLQHSQLIQNEISLTHCNPLLKKAGLFWVNTLTMLINRKNDSKQEFQYILNKNIFQDCFKDLKDWIQEASTQIKESMSATKSMGFAKIAFSYGLKALFYIVEGKQTKLDQSFYFRWLRWIIKRAGDTDTNACIAGGLLGSIVGFWNLPTKYVVRSLKTITDRRLLKIEDEQEQIILNLKNPYVAPKRPSFYQPANALFLTLDIVEKCKQYNQNHNKS